MAQAERKKKIIAKENEAIAKTEDLLIQTLKLPLSIGLGLVSLIVFLMTLNPHMGAGDSGTIISASYLAGINHPPGYPLYTMLGKLFTYLPFGSPGYRVNLMNSLMTIGASLLFLHAFMKITRNPWASLLGAGMFCFAPGIWQYAVTAEVFALNNLMIALLFYFLTIYVQTGEKKYAYLGTLAFGLGMSNHHTMIFFGFPFAGLVLIKGKKDLLNPLELLKICLIFFVGLLPYLYLIWAPNVDHIESWGNTGSYDGFMTHLLRKEYGTISLRADLKGGSFIQGVYEYFKQLPFELLFIGPLVAFYGVFKSYKTGKKYNGLLNVSVFSFLLYIVVFHLLSKFDLTNIYYYQIVYRFWQMPLMIVCFWVALGAKEILDLKPIKPVIVGSIISLLILIQIGVNYKDHDESKNEIYVAFAKNVLESLPKDTLLLIKGDIYINSLIYTQFALNVRPDVKVMNIGRMKGYWYKKKVLDTYPQIVFPRDIMVPIGMDPRKMGLSGGYTLSDFIFANKKKFPVYTNLHSSALKTAKKYFDLWPWGLVFEVELAGTMKKNIQFFIKQSKELIYKYKAPEGYQASKSSHEEIVQGYYDNALESIGLQLANIVNKNQWDTNFYYESVRLIHERIEKFPNANYKNYRSLGLVYRMIPGKIGYQGKMKSFQEYLKTAPKTDPSYGLITNEFNRGVNQKR